MIGVIDVTDATDASELTEAERLVDFVNTLDVESGFDVLARPATATPWLRRRGQNGSATAADLSRLRELREALRTCLLHHHDGIDDDDDLTALAGHASGAALRVELLPTPHTVPAGTGIDAVISGVLLDIALAVERGRWQRIKVCPVDTCLEGFVDTSRNGSRRWCSMGVCGNRTKVRQHRARAGR